ncbi:MAG: hypothetical protein O3B13_18640 [Planctomycetota bacterium]|nr:hypothetical protein [Planctomycetota bacterium]
MTETSRREFLIGLAAGSIATGVRLNASGTLAAAEKSVLNAARQQAVNRRRRVIYNNDGDDIWAKGTDTVEKFLGVRHTPLLDSHVDSIHYCTTQSFNHFTHDTRVAEVFRAKSGKFAGNNLQPFLDQKTDGLRMSSEFARKNGLESIWTLRMNDIHDAWTAEFLSDWKRQDPTRVMSTLAAAKDFKDRRRLWSLVDFEHPDVQPRLLEIIEEVLQNYDVDGVELDFLRAPFYFRTGYDGQPATDSQIEILTRLVRAIHQLVQKESEKRGEPLLLTARVPTTVSLCRRIGIEIESWLEEKLLDTMSLGGGYITFDVPVAELIALGHQHGLPVYPCLSQSGLMQRPPRGTSTKQPPEAWLGAAARLWADGADGIYSFNLFPGPGTDADREYARKVLTTIGSPQKLHASTIQYAMSDAGGWMPSHYWAKDAADYSRALPLPLKSNDFTQTYMIVPEDLRGSDISVTAEVRVDFTGLSKDSQPTILFGSANFGPQSDGQEIAGVRRFTCRVPLQAISQGRNRVMVKVAEEDAQLAGVELWINRP